MCVICPFLRHIQYGISVHIYIDILKDKSLDMSISILKLNKVYMEIIPSLEWNGDLNDDR